MASPSDDNLFHLSPGAYRAVREIMQQKKVATPAEAIRGALGTELALQRAQRSGHEVLLAKFSIFQRIQQRYTLEGIRKLRQLVWPAPK